MCVRTSKQRSKEPCEGFNEHNLFVEKLTKIMRLLTCHVLLQYYIISRIQRSDTENDMNSSTRQAV